MNRWTGMGRLTRDPELRVAQSGNSVARFTLAIDRRTKGEKVTDFINCIAFGTTADAIHTYAKQGTKLLVEGSIQTGSYTNKDGRKVYTTDIAVSSFEFAESRGTQGRMQEKPVESAPEQMSFVDAMDDEGLPFN